jgi:CRISPR-associated protein Csy1
MLKMSQKSSVTEMIAQFVTENVEVATIDNYRNEDNKKAKNELFENITDRLKVKQIKKIKAIIKEMKKTSFEELEVHEFFDWFKEDYFITKQKLKRLASRSNESVWLDWVVSNGENVLRATHVAKLLHSSSKASSLCDYSISRRIGCLSTSNIPSLNFDGAYSDSKNSKIVQLFMTEVGEDIFETYLRVYGTSCLNKFALDDVQEKEWENGFKRILFPSTRKSHSLAKQVYFPLGSSKYHILTILQSSSLSDALFSKIIMLRQDEQKAADDLRKRKRYSDSTVVKIPNLALIRTTASQPQNVSTLNSKRAKSYFSDPRKRFGYYFLLSSNPPQWQQKLKPPTKKASLFYSELTYQSRETVKNLQKLLTAIKINERSKNDLKIHQRITELVNEIIDMVFNYVQSIHALKAEAGWSVDSTLKEAHQLWLDPYRGDEEFQKKRNQKEWHKEIEDDFSLWLNKQLEHKKMIPGKQLQRLWKDIFAPRFREFNAITEAEL